MWILSYQSADMIEEGALAFKVKPRVVGLTQEQIDTAPFLHMSVVDYARERGRLLDQGLLDE